MNSEQRASSTSRPICRSGMQADRLRFILPFRMRVSSPKMFIAMSSDSTNKHKGINILTTRDIAREKIRFRTYWTTRKKWNAACELLIACCVHENWPFDWSWARQLGFWWTIRVIPLSTWLTFRKNTFLWKYFFRCSLNCSFVHIFHSECIVEGTIWIHNWIREYIFIIFGSLGTQPNYVPSAHQLCVTTLCKPLHADHSCPSK